MIEDYVLSKTSFICSVVFLKISKKCEVDPHLLTLVLIEVNISIKSSAGNTAAMGVFGQTGETGRGVWGTEGWILGIENSPN